jgi:hypothetical protein
VPFGIRSLIVHELLNVDGVIAVSVALTDWPATPVNVSRAFWPGVNSGSVTGCPVSAIGSVMSSNSYRVTDTVPLAAEAFFASLTKELGDRFPSYGEAKMAMFDYIEVFYNQRRRHSTLGQISPPASKHDTRRRKR